MERVQKWFTRMALELRNFSYEDRLEKLALFSLVRRRLREDLIKVIKITRWLDRAEREKPFPLIKRIENESAYRFIVIHKRSKSDVRKSFFTQRVVQVWNALPRSMVEAGSIEAFKRAIDDCLN